MSTASDSAILKLYSPPVLGGSGSLALDGTDKSVAVTRGRMVLVTAKGGDAFLAIGGDSTVAANQTILLDGSVMAIMIPFAPVPGDGALHATQGPAAGGTLYYSVID